MLERRQWSLSSCHFLLSSSAVFHQKPSLHCFCFPRYPTYSTEASHPNLSTYATWHLKEALACRSSLNQRRGRIGFCSVYRTPNDAVKWPRERSRTEGSLRCTWVLHWEAAKTFSRGGAKRGGPLPLVTLVNLSNLVNCRDFAIPTFRFSVSWTAERKKQSSPNWISFIYGTGWKQFIWSLSSCFEMVSEVLYDWHVMIWGVKHLFAPTQRCKAHGSSTSARPVGKE